MRSVRYALAVGLVAVAAALGVVLSRAPLTVAASNGIPARPDVTIIRGARVICQDGGAIPASTTAVRISLSANVGPSIHLTVLSHLQPVTSGSREAGWGTTETVTVPVARVAQTIESARLCLTLGPTAELIQVNGARGRTSTGAHRTLLRFEYLLPGQRSWLSLASSVASRLGLARAAGGAWVAYVVVAGMIAVLVLASRLILRELS
jgi:hypothetical protein